MISLRGEWSPPAEAFSATDEPRVEVIERLYDLQRLRERWSDLFDLCPEAPPFLSPEWLLPWGERFLKGRPWVLVALRRDRLVGLLPLHVVPRAEGRTACLMGGPITDYQGALVAPGRAGQGVRAALMARLCEESAHWDLCDLEQLRPGEALLDAPLPAGFATEVFDQEPCPYVPLPALPDDFTAGLPGGLGPKLHRAVRGFHRAGTLAFERADDHNADEIMDALFRLHAARWNTRQAPGVLSGEDLQQFHREVAAGMLTRGRLRLSALRLDGRIEAVVYGFAHGRRFYSYLGGFNPVLGRLSPGLVSIWQAMLASIEEGLEEFDFLRGNEAYKFRFGAHVRWNRRRVLRPI
jgi:CelD/BcsL family acetyltransferase involved in cellulose biosynthesis